MLLVVLKLGQSGLAQTVAQVSAGEPAGPQPSLPYSANLVNALPDQGVAEPAGSATPATSGGTGPADGPTKVVATFDSLTNGTNHSGPIFQDIFNLRNKSSWKGQRPVSGVGSANFQTTNVTRNPKNFPWTRGGGRLVEPPNRSSVWRQGRTGAMVNLNDDQLNCGAETMPVMFMEGDEPVCGVCGDALFGPQDNLIGGRYVSFPTRVTRYYDASLSNIIPVTFFLNQTVIPGLDTVTFGLCHIINRMHDVTWECVEDSRLHIEMWGNTYYPGHSGMHSVVLRIPPHVTCSHCVLQWHWKTSVVADRAYCQSHPLLRVCYSPVEYINCADITISRSSAARSSTRPV
ncbi:hypothetical protein C0Q70_07055 [Pomacea canaliculata]|uniref:Chitin-binding type-4 domain-containing protein n=2 Tax=Pomacea canaliculata TaxID=400727 RepID=A0A2T7PE02_POMCA|nr:hypothetical protein C0Q70_07055 [Pomacea canaliculata]